VPDIPVEAKEPPPEKQHLRNFKAGSEEADSAKGELQNKIKNFRKLKIGMCAADQNGVACHLPPHDMIISPH